MLLCLAAGSLAQRSVTSWTSIARVSTGCLLRCCACPASLHCAVHTGWLRPVACTWHACHSLPCMLHAVLAAQRQSLTPLPLPTPQTLACQRRRRRTMLHYCWPTVSAQTSGAARQGLGAWEFEPLAFQAVRERSMRWRPAVQASSVVFASRPVGALGCSGAELLSEQLPILTQAFTLQPSNQSMQTCADGDVSKARAAGEPGLSSRGQRWAALGPRYCGALATLCWRSPHVLG